MQRQPDKTGHICVDVNWIAKLLTKVAR